MKRWHSTSSSDLRAVPRYLKVKDSHQLEIFIKESRRLLYINSVRGKLFHINKIFSDSQKRKKGKNTIASVREVYIKRIIKMYVWLRYVSVNSDSGLEHDVNI